MSKYKTHYNHQPPIYTNTMNMEAKEIAKILKDEGAAMMLNQLFIDLVKEEDTEKRHDIHKCNWDNVLNALQSLSSPPHAKSVSDEDIEKLAYERHPERILPEWGGAKPMDLNLEKRELFKRDAKWMQDRLPQQTEGKEHEFSCRECGSEMNEGEAKTFTCCDKCWDKHYIKPEAS